MNPDDNVRFADDESFAAKQEDSFRSLLFEMLRKVASLNASEFRGGFYERRLSQNGNVVQETYVPDSRETFSGAISFLHSLLANRFDADMKTVSVRCSKMLRDNESNRVAQIKDFEARGADKTQLDFINDTYKVNRLNIMTKMLHALLAFLNRKKFFEADTAVED